MGILSQLFDPSSLLILATALFVMWYGSKRSKSSPLDSPDVQEEAGGEENTSIQLKQAIIMPVLGSVSLVVLFYFLNIIYWLLVVILGIAVFVSMIYVWQPIVDGIIIDILHREPTKKFNILTRWCDPTPVSTLIAMIFSLIMVVIWIVTNNWAVIDFLAICNGIASLSFMRVPNLKIASILLGLFFVYDVFWVFFSHLIFKESVMVSVATKSLSLGLPIVIKYPKLNYLWNATNYIVMPNPLNELVHRYVTLATSDYTINWFIIGMGDLILPGVWINFLYRLDDRMGKSWKSGYFLTGMVGYTLGMFATQIAVFLMRQGQPALLYLVPFILVPVTIQGRIKNELHILWQGMTYFDQQEEQQELMEQGEINGNEGDEKLVFLVRRPDLEQKQEDE
jgi:hypothetical protein